LTSIENRLIGEIFTVRGDNFEIELVEGRVRREDCVLESVSGGPHAIQAVYHGVDLKVEVTYRLDEKRNFLEKTLCLASAKARGLRKVTISQPSFQGPGRMDIFDYRYQKNATYFCRTSRGGLFTGVEL